MIYGDKVRVVRTSGIEENDWEFVREFEHPVHGHRVQVRRWEESIGDFLLKAPSKELFDYWQVGGTAASTQEYREAMKHVEGWSHE